MSDEDTIKEYNERLKQTSGIFGDFPAASYQVTEDNPAGNTPALVVTPGAEYHPEPEDLTKKYETPTVEDREEDEEARESAGPAHAALEGITDPSDGATQTTASPEDQANASAIPDNELALGEADDPNDNEDADNAGQGEVSTDDTQVSAEGWNQPETPAEAAEQTQTGEGDNTPAQSQSREEKIEAISNAQTVEEVDELLGDDDRVTVKRAAEARKEELKSQD